MTIQGCWLNDNLRKKGHLVLAIEMEDKLTGVPGPCTSAKYFIKPNQDALERPICVNYYVLLKRIYHLFPIKDLKLRL